jgi:hypothetical protein
VNIEKNVKFNDIGQEITVKIQLEYKDLEVFEFPANCSKCPVGFCVGKNCGRNVPFADEDYKIRPKTCKLKKIGYTDLIEKGGVG